MLGGVTGMHKSATRGSSVEFAEYRKYVLGDDIRHIDWQVFGRSDKYFIKEFEADTNLRCYMVVDASGSMNYESEYGNRFKFASSLVAHLAYLLLQQGDGVGLSCCSEKVNLDIPARQTPSHLQNLFDTLLEMEPKGESTLPDALHKLAERVQRRALVVVFTDGLVPTDELLDSIAHLKFCRHDVSLFHLVDPTELQFDFNRPIRFVDLEGAGDLIAEPAIIRDSYLTAMETHMQALLQGCRRYHIDYRQVDVNADVEQCLSAFLLERAGKANGGGPRT